MALLAGAVSREDVHNWAHPWVMDEEGIIRDLMVRTGMQRLHGFDLVADPEKPGVVRHGGGQEYVWTQSEIENELQSWRASCTLYDSNPRDYREAMRERLRACMDGSDLME